MKRSFEDYSFCLDDLRGQFRALLNLSLESCSKELYNDDFLIYIDHDINQHNLKFRWYCNKFFGRANTSDSRNHEDLLRKHFEHYNLTINKGSDSWCITVSAPDKPLGVHRTFLASSSIK